MSLSGSDILGYQMGRRDLGSHSDQICSILGTAQSCAVH
nr:MAG TPA: hypothetical protein [Caudoviricetes sp.]